MPKIKKVEEAKNSFILHFQDTTTITVDKELYFTQAMYTWEEITPAEMASLLRLQLIQSALIDAKKFLQGQLKPVRRVIGLLETKNHSREIIDDVIFRLEQEGQLDDIRYAKKILKQKTKTGILSKNKMKALLVQQGIDEESAHEIVEKSPMDDMKNGCRLYQKQTHRDENSMYRYLISKGFEPETSREIIQSKGEML